MFGVYIFFNGKYLFMLFCFVIININKDVIEWVVDIIFLY